MKVNITFKDPDSLSDQLEDDKFMLVKKLRSELGLSQEGAEAEAEARMMPLRELARRFFQYGEYVTIELDSEAKTAVVLECKD